MAFATAVVQWLHQSVLHAPPWMLLLPADFVVIIANQYSCTNFDLLGPLTVLPRQLLASDASLAICSELPPPPHIFLPALQCSTMESYTANTLCSIKLGSWGYHEMDRDMAGAQSRGWDKFIATGRRMASSCFYDTSLSHVIIVSANLTSFRGFADYDNFIQRLEATGGKVVLEAPDQAIPVGDALGFIEPSFHRISPIAPDINLDGFTRSGPYTMAISPSSHLVAARRQNTQQVLRHPTIGGLETVFVVLFRGANSPVSGTARRT